MPDLLLLSNSTDHGRGYLEHALGDVAAFLDGVDELLFVPFAGADHDAYTAKVAAALEPLGIRVAGLHTAVDPVAAVDAARAVFVGGGNTFRLLARLQRDGLIEPIRQAVERGLRYMGASAGTNIASPTIRTTNDMPIVQPRDLVALWLVPFQINPHFIDADPRSTHAGETRETRLAEFLEENDVDVLGLREGTHLRLTGSGGGASAVVGGTAVSASAPGPAVLLRRGARPREVAGDVTELLGRPARFDVPPGA